MADEQPGADRARLAGVLVARLPWMLTAAASGAPDRASCRAARPPKQKPTAATCPLVPGAAVAASAASPARARRTRNAGSSRRAIRQPDDAVPVPGDAVAEHVAGQDDVAERGIAAGLLPGMLVKAGAAVDEHDARPVLARVGGVDEELTGQFGIAVRVRQRLGANHKPNSNREL